MKRFYREATAAAEPAAGAGGGFAVLLDGRPIKTPAKAPLVLPTQALAAAIAAEWQQQPEDIDPHTMPLMRLAATAIDRVSVLRQAVIDEVAAYAGADLVCYRAERPLSLVARQRAVWQPVLDWLRRRYDVDLRVTSGIVAVAQSEAALVRLKAAVAAANDMELSALQALTTVFGSLTLALAVFEGEMTAEMALAASLLDELFQAERWGEDAEAAKRRAGLARDVASSGYFLQLLHA